MAIELLGIVLRYPDWTKLEQIAMACMFGRASAQGNALINGLPGVHPGMSGAIAAPTHKAGLKRNCKSGATLLLLPLCRNSPPSMRLVVGEIGGMLSVRGARSARMHA
ncbi:MAG: hypothetical protein V7K24_05715 [Nostoc sp.]